MKFHRNTLAAAAVALIAATPGFAQSLPPEAKDKLKEAAEFMNQDMLVEAYEYLACVVENCTAAAPIKTMVILSLLSKVRNASDSSTYQKAADVTEGDPFDLTEEQKASFRQLVEPFIDSDIGSPFDFILLQIKDGSTSWCGYSVTTGKCYRRS